MAGFQVTTEVYWIGVAMAIACFALVLAGNTELVWRFEHTRLPLSWMFAGGAVLAFLATELCHPAFSLPAESKNRNVQLERASLLSRP
jgi:hypothetical protein